MADVLAKLGLNEHGQRFGEVQKKVQEKDLENKSFQESQGVQELCPCQWLKSLSLDEVPEEYRAFRKFLDSKSDLNFKELKKPEKPPSDRIYFEVAFMEKEKAKTLGARWDPQVKKWYANKGFHEPLEKGGFKRANV